MGKLYMLYCLGSGWFDFGICFIGIGIGNFKMWREYCVREMDDVVWYGRIGSVDCSMVFDEK